MPTVPGLCGAARRVCPPVTGGGGAIHEIKESGVAPPTSRMHSAKSDVDRLHRGGNRYHAKGAKNAKRNSLHGHCKPWRSLLLSGSLGRLDGAHHCRLAREVAHQSI